MKNLDLLRVVLLVGIALVASKGADAQPAPAHLRGVRPLVQFSVRRGANSWRSASNYEPLRYGNLIRAAEGGKAEILFANGTRIAMKPGTQIELLSAPDEGKPLIIGLVGALSEIFVRAKGPTLIRTASGTAAVRGTQFFVRAEGDKQTRVTVTEGLVGFYNDVDPQGVDLAPGFTSTATPTTAPTRPERVDLSGLFDWTGEVMGLPLPFEWPFTNPSNAGERLFNQNRFGEAAMALEPFANANNTAAAYAALGRAQLFEGDTKKAAASYAKVRALAPSGEYAGQAILADALLCLSDENLSGEALQAQVDNADRAPLFSAVQGLADLQSGDSKAAIAHLTGQTSFQAKTLLALALVQENDLPAAVAAAREAVRLEPNSPGAHAALSMVTFFRGDNKTARGEANQSVKLDPMSPLALLALGRAQLVQGRTDEARSAFAQAAALAPELPVIQVELGLVENRLQHFAWAEKAFHHALDKTPTDARALGGLATAIYRQGRTAQARELFARALQADPNNAGVRAQYTDLLVREGRTARDLQSAAASAQLLLETRNTDTPVVGALLIRLSEAELFAQNLPAAFDYARRAVGLLPGSAPAHYQLGRVYLERGSAVSAQQQFRVATQLDPELTDARYALGLTQEYRSSGRDITDPIGQSAATVESGQSSSSIRDLMTPGASERVQASVQDPTVAGVATRALGQIQFDGQVGEDSLVLGSISALVPSDDRRRLLGINAEHSDYDGPRDNAGNRLNRGEVLFGQKAHNGPSGLWALVNTQTTEPGQDFGVNSNAYLSGVELQRKVSTALLGYNWQNKESQRTRFVFGADSLDQNGSDAFNGSADRNVRSYHAEVRHDLRLGDHRLSLGFSLGHRTFDNTDFLFSNDPMFPSETSRTNLRYDLASVYLRDVWQPGAKWRLTGELKGVRLKRELETSTTPAFPGVPDGASQRTSSQLLPTLVVEHSLSASTSLRFRARRVLGNFNDFDLLAPTDVFLFTASEEYLPNLGNRSDALDLELDHTFKDGSFFRAGAFSRSLSGTASKATGLDYLSSRVKGLTVGYEGVLDRRTTYFLNAQLLHGQGDRSDTLTGTFFNNERLGGVPRFQAEIGGQYLADNGCFVQPSIAYLGDRDVYQFGPLGTTRGQEDSTVLANLRVGKRWGLRSVVYVEVVNLFNHNYSLGSDYNQRQATGRQFRLGTTFRF